MSIPVDLSDLARTMAPYRFAYVLTSGASGAPRAVAVAPVLESGVFVLGNLGRRTRENAAARPEVGLLWPPLDIGGYSLIVDGIAEVTDRDVRVTPKHAVLHRPALAERADCGE